MRKVIKVIVVAGLMGGALSGCDFIKGFFRVDAKECGKWNEHVQEVVVGAVKKAAPKGCKVDEKAVKADIESYTEKDCTTYDGNQPLKKRDFDCMMKADSPEAIDKCYDAIPETTTSTKTTKIGNSKFKKKETKQNTTMEKPQLAKWATEEAGFACAGDADEPADDKADKKGDKKADDKKKDEKKDEE